MTLETVYDDKNDTALGLATKAAGAVTVGAVTAGATAAGDAASEGYSSRRLQ